MYRQAPLLSPAHLLHRLPARHVHDHDWDADNFGVADRAVRRFSFDDLRPRCPVKIWRNIAFAFQFFGQVRMASYPSQCTITSTCFAAGHLETSSTVCRSERGHHRS